MQCLKSNGSTQQVRAHHSSYSTNVGEGYAEDRLLRHIRAIYTNEKNGYKLTLGNARGYEAQNVIDHAIRLTAQASYDRVAALFDTDAGWNNTAKKKAQDNNITVLLSEPCIEAWLLAIAGSVKEGTTQEHKIRFRNHFGCDAHQEGLFERHFPREILDVARTKVEALNNLLDFLKV